MTPDLSRGMMGCEEEGCAPPASQDRVLALRAEPRKRVSSLRASPDWRDALLDDGTNPLNRVCSQIAIVMLGGMLAIYLETLL